MDNRHTFFYANAAASGFTNYDFTVIMQRRGITGEPVVSPNVPVATDILERVDISMAPGHMKIFAANVLESLMAYEQQFGPIPLAPTEKAQFDSVMSRFRADKKGTS